MRWDFSLKQRSEDLLDDLRSSPARHRLAEQAGAQSSRGSRWAEGFLRRLAARIGSPRPIAGLEEGRR